MKPAVCLAALTALAGCTVATAPPQEPSRRIPQGTCKTEPGQRFVGTKASAALGSELLAATGGRTLRWVPPRTAVTMDYRPDRLTVSYDDHYVIRRVSCG